MRDKNYALVENLTENPEIRFESKVEKLHKEAKGYLDAVRGLFRNFAIERTPYNQVCLHVYS